MEAHIRGGVFTVECSKESEMVDAWSCSGGKFCTSSAVCTGPMDMTGNPKTPVVTWARCEES